MGETNSVQNILIKLNFYRARENGYENIVQEVFNVAFEGSRGKLCLKISLKE